MMQDIRNIKGKLVCRIDERLALLKSCKKAANSNSFQAGWNGESNPTTATVNKTK